MFLFHLVILLKMVSIIIYLLLCGITLVADYNCKGEESGCISAKLRIFYKKSGIHIRKNTDFSKIAAKYVA